MRKVITRILIVLSIILIGVGAFLILQKVNKYKESEDAFKKVEEIADTPKDDNNNSDDKNDSEEWSPNFSSLNDEYSEVVAWIKFQNEPSVINYPVMHRTGDNNYYLYHLPDGTYNPTGSIFLSMTSSTDFSDFNSVIYGHDLYDRSMFGSLDKYRDYTFLLNNPYFDIFLPDGTKETYKIWNVATVDGTDDIYLSVPRTNSKELSDYIVTCKNKALYESGIIPTASDDMKIVTLSTCTGRTQMERLVVQGYIVN